MNNALTGKQFLDAVASSLTALVARGLESLFGPSVTAPRFGGFSLSDFAIFFCFLLVVMVLHALAAAFLRHRRRKAEAHPAAKEWGPPLVHAVGKPLYLLIWIYGIYFAATPIFLKVEPLRVFLNKLFDVGIFAVVFWLFFRLARVLEVWLKSWAKSTSSKWDDLLIPLLGRTLRVIIPVVALIMATPVLGLSAAYSGILDKLGSILVIGTVAWILVQAVRFGEKAVLTEYDITAADNLQARKLYTQVHVLSRTIYVLIAIFTIASVLMLFEEVRRLGTSILASAGVVGVIAGFAAQRTIANLFAGFQLAMTQPIRLDDVLIVENEWGRVEEITLTYVIIHIWDDRRLVVPLSYFIEKPFQNWTRVSAQLLGSVFLWVDYSLPLAPTREAVRKIVEASPLWDHRFWNLQVTDATERTMQIRVLATASNSSNAWDLRCEIREKLIDFIQKTHPQSLPRLRTELDRPDWMPLTLEPARPPARASADTKK
jgi:small-conductance mechanosensitive channel